MSFTRVPPELLDEIVGHLSDRATLKRLALTNRWFHHLSRPLLFTSFKFHPYSLAAYLEGEARAYVEDLVLPQAEELERARGRLEFWVSDEIAPYVLKCHVEPLDFIGVPRPGQDPYMLLAAFFSLLPRFVNLQHFGGFYVQFTRVAMTNLCALPKLRSITIDSCVVAHEEILDTPSKLFKLDDFTLSTNEHQLEEWWFHALCPDTLRVLHVNLYGLKDTLGTLLLPLSGLRRLTIERCHSDKCLAAIHSVSRANSVEYLEICLVQFVLSLGGFGEIFPSLSTLVLTLDGRRFSQVTDDVALSAILHDLPSSLPPNIAKVAINWEFEHKVQPPNLAQVKDDIVSHRPMLKTFWVHCTDFVYVWSEMPGGQQHSAFSGSSAMSLVFTTG
ncbi:hypothetical protein DFH09DRAFT_173921 [Mycena vulgaris]|nr:hypothetical protein DFH09DRAFT_173921 [Mycena vulgaris]